MAVLLRRLTKATPIAAFSQSFRGGQSNSASPNFRLPVGAIAAVTGGVSSYYYFSSSTAWVYSDEVKEDAGPKMALNPDNWVEFKLQDKAQVSHNTQLFRFSFDPSVKLGLDIASCILTRAPTAQDAEGKTKYVIRPYTPISDPDAKGYFDLMIKLYPEGKMSQHFASLIPGDVLEVKGPIEKLRYSPNMKKHIGMIAGGSGITPMLQIIEAILKNPDDNTQVSLLYANVSPDDILLKKKLDVLAASHPNLKIFYTVDNATNDWMGGKGYISKDMIVKGLPGPGDDSLVLVCGPPGMMRHISGDKAKDRSQGELTGLLKEVGYTESMVNDILLLVHAVRHKPFCCYREEAAENETRTEIWAFYTRKTFNAFPLLNKENGIECEYRHSEMARLNPRDCWYWLAGSCLNPSCAFRHPPLDGCTETASESASARHQSALAVNKTNVACYYYYNGYCNKGERCIFMHGPEDNTAVWKSSKQASVVVDGPPLEKKMSTGSDSGPAPAEIRSFRSDPKSTTGSKVVPEQESHQPTPNHAAEDHHPTPNHAADKSVCPLISESSSEEHATIRSNSPIQTEGLVQRRSHESADQSSENQLGNHIKKEEWLESSPGFDVLVSDRSEHLDYGDEALYLIHHDMQDTECNAQQLGYGYENNIEYDPMYPQISVSFEREIPDCYENVEEDICKSPERTPFPARERVLDRTLLRKRKHLETELAGIDLRDYLKERRTESQSTKYFSGRPHSSRLIGKIREKAFIGGRRHLRGRLASKVEISVESRIEAGACLGRTYQHGRTRRPCTNRSRSVHQNKERKQGKRQILSEIFAKTASRKKRSTEESTMFTGPKTLAQIKEEKEKALGGRDFDDRRGPSSCNA
ncbi:hypothetical protein ACH5RR_005881 [Cinchona calisaya]|uniref:cytochrome-b5 reductase n=1 Tax=Cinchona calisaya TaxID=153742 RepID=A0ABD3AMD5_9GENT